MQRNKQPIQQTSTGHTNKQQTNKHTSALVEYNLYTCTATSALPTAVTNFNPLLLVLCLCTSLLFLVSSKSGNYLNPKLKQREFCIAPFQTEKWNTTAGAEISTNRRPPLHETTCTTKIATALANVTTKNATQLKLNTYIHYFSINAASQTESWVVSTTSTTWGSKQDSRLNPIPK